MTTESAVKPYALGLDTLSACAPSSLTIAEVEAELNLISPTGIDSLWTWAQGESFKSGHPNPNPCDQEPQSRVHYLFHC